MLRDINVKLYSRVYKEGLTYEKALEECKKGAYITRPEWNGFHYIENGTYKIMLKEGLIMENPKEVYDKDKSDWCIVEITIEALKLMMR